MKCHAKLNIFLKVVGFRGDYHELASRFVRFDGLFDELDFTPREEASGLVLRDPFERNIIARAYDALLALGRERGFAALVERFFATHQVALTKRIPSGAGLGGGSSDAAGFLRLCNERLGLGLAAGELAAVGAAVGADVSFFVRGWAAANVRGVGEDVREFADDVPALELVLSPLFCSTPAVFGEFRRGVLAAAGAELGVELGAGGGANSNLTNGAELGAEFGAAGEFARAKFAENNAFARGLFAMSSREILARFGGRELNDLIAPCERLYGGFGLGAGEFLSGSGSAKFRLKSLG